MGIIDERVDPGTPGSQAGTAGAPVCGGPPSPPKPNQGVRRGPGGPPHQSEPSRRTVIVGYGNPLCGDDGIGPAAARLLAGGHAASGATLLELSGSALDLVEGLAGYERAIVIDALVDERAPVGTVVPLGISEGRIRPRLGFHSAGLADALALARAAGMEVPADIRLYGIVIREPAEFRESLSAELEARLLAIVREIAAHA